MSNSNPLFEQILTELAKSPELLTYLTFNAQRIIEHTVNQNVKNEIFRIVNAELQRICDEVNWKEELQTAAQRTVDSLGKELMHYIKQAVNTVVTEKLENAFSGHGDCCDCVFR